MANYSIVLNLRGSAVKNSKKLADNLERADKAAKSLKGNLQNMPNLPTGGRGGGGGYGGRGTASNPLYTEGRQGWHSTFSTQSGFGSVYSFGAKASAIFGGLELMFRGLSSAVKLLAKANVLAYTGGVKALKSSADVLTSSQMGEGIRLLQRRQQARLGFGAGYAEAQERADLLAASYGLDPSNVIASMNVLAGMKVGGRKISTAQAERLTQVGGLIAQQSGMSFETVMINIQQMMSQAVPSMRDIRQLLTHAPILGRYALQEMEKKGVTGMTAMEYLKADKGGLMAVFERYLSENPAMLSMRARGVAQRAQTGFYATLAENPSWLTLSGKYAESLKVVAESLSKLLSALTDSQAINTSIYAFINFVEDIPRLINKIKLPANGIAVKLFEALGIPLGDYKENAQIRAATEGFIASELRKNVKTLRKYAPQLGLSAKDTDEEFFRVAQDYILGQGWKKFAQFGGSPRDITRRVRYLTKQGTSGYYDEKVSVAEQRKLYGAVNPTAYLFGDEVQKHLGVVIDTKGMLASIKNRKLTAPENLKGLGLDATGEAISGYGSDRKSLVINFNAPIVEWDSTINADDPQDVVNTVTETIEGAASRAIQIALLGATGTMSSRY